MYLSKLGNMFTETSGGENVGEIKEEPSVIDLDFGIRKLSVLPEPYESSFMRADESCVTAVASDVASTDVLLSAFNSIGFAEHTKQRKDIAKNITKADACVSGPIGPQITDKKVSSIYDSSEITDFAEPSTREDGEAEVVNEIDKTRTRNNPLIVYTSSRRKSFHKSDDKLNRKQSRKPSRNFRKVAKKNSVLDLNSLQISRKRRSLFFTRARSSVWGVLGNILPAFEEHIGVEPNSGNAKKLKRVRGGQAKKNNIRGQTGSKSVHKSCTPTGHISLKIKIGNQSCGMVNAPDKVNATGKIIPDLSDINESKSGGELPRDMELPHEGNLEKVLSSDVSDLGTHLDVRVSVENSSFSTSSGLHQIISQEEGDNLRASTENRCSDPGTSPDSEVINTVPDAPLCEKGLQTMRDSTVMPMEGKNQECFTDSVPYISFGDVSSLSFPRMKSKKGKKKDKHHQLGDCSVESKLTGAETTNKAKTSAELEPGQKADDVSYCNDACAIATVKPYLNNYTSNRVPRGPSRCSKMIDLGAPSITSESHIGAEPNPSSRLGTAIGSSNSQGSETLISCSNGQKFPKCSRGKGGRKSTSGISDLPCKKDKASKKKGARYNLVDTHQIDEKGDASGVLGGMERHLEAGNQASSDLEEIGDLNKDSSRPLNNLHFSSGGISDQHVLPRNAWVLCDECQKWRRIPATLADQIEETNCGWTCKDNTDKDFADCSIPQEKSNSEINEELEISDASCEEDASDTLLKSNQNRSKAAQQSSWSLIKSNLFLHRSRKNQTIDEVMVCHCKPPSDGRMGCGAKCLNRVLNIECVQGTCPCGELCSNQQFQRRKYAKLKWLRCGKKGFGLQALQDISEAQFLIEYVGEVLDMHAYEARQREYAIQGHKHFYFMTLNGSEVIDASAKGNLGRFINHSCDPNCRTEKWMVNGEVCVGLFATRDIKKGEEVTFDYNFVRVFGAAAKKCVCGSLNCRGYIGGDPTNSEVIVQDDSDEEYAEPVMICEDKEMNDDWNDIMSNFLYDAENQSADEPPDNVYRMKEPVDDAGQFEGVTSETSIQKVGADSASTDGCVKTSTAAEVVEMMVRDKPDNSVGYDFASNAAVGQLDTNKDTEGLLNSSASAATALPSKSRPATFESKKKLKYGTRGRKEELAKSDSLVRTRSPSSSIKKGKLKSNVVNDKGSQDVDKSNSALHKSKKLPGLPVNSLVEAVEEKLNELLDTEGGISKRKDASRGYLKLLFLTAASGANGHGESIQSNRDLSMILDALLKTKSRTVLVDIMNKNGLQMLHNIMKRYRKEFIKTPILRKLLKILEYLATREILTLEHITGGPPCPGVESFKDSILTLTEHADKQVHQIARNFRDRWIPRSLRKNCFMETDDGNVEFHQRSSYGRLFVSSYDQWSDRDRKPEEAIAHSATQTVAASGTVDSSSVDHSSAAACSSGASGTRTRKRKSRWDNPVEEHLHPRIRTDLTCDGKHNIDEDIPPGFSIPCNASIVPADASSTALNRQERDMCIKHPFNIVLGESEQRFISRMPVSYGIPASVMQQFGVLQAESAKGWTVAPASPFHPFPPLPPYACTSGEPATSAATCASLSEPAEKAEQCYGTCVGQPSGHKHMMSCSVDPSELNNLEASGQQDFQREGGSYGLGRKYFRQQKWNHSKLLPPWVRMRNGWAHAGNGRNGVPGVGLGNGANQLRNSHNSEDFNWRGEF